MVALATFLLKKCTLFRFFIFNDKNNNMLPIYYATIEEEKAGILKISLVDFPAVESDFIAFSADEKRLTFAVQNEEEHMIMGVVMRAEHSIYRNDNGFEYLVRYSKDTIKTMAEKMLFDLNHNNINLMHKQDTEGVNLVQLFIKDETKGISPKGFEDIEEGSLFAVYKVENDDVWEKVKDGTFRGFSLEGYFDMKPEKNMKMSKFEKLKKSIKSLLMEFGEINTDKGIIEWEGEEELKAGDEVKIDGNPAEDGEYVTEDGKVIKVVEGKVAEINDPEAEVAPEEAMEEEAPVAEPAEEPVEEPAAEPEWKAEIDAIKARFDGIEASIEELRQAVDKILKTPAKEPVTEEFKMAKQVEDKDEKLKMAIEIAKTLKNN